MADALTDRFRFLAKGGTREKTPILAAAPDPKTNNGVAVLRLYDPIDSWGEYFGVSAKEFVEVLDALPEDTSEIHVHINSPGGEVFEGIAILNALRSHEAKVVTIIDGLAASAASFIAMAGDEVVMARNSELMIHDAWGVCVGNAADMQSMASELGHFSDNLADIYAGKAGGTVEEWRAVMEAETWYSADEAVAAGLADRVDAKPADDKAKNRYDLSVFAYAGRSAAPTPTAPVASAPGNGAAGATTKEVEVGMSDTLLEGLREQLGLPADADEATVLAKNQEALAALQVLNDQEPPKPAIDPEPLLAEITRVSTELAELKQASASRQKDELFAGWLRDGKTSPAERKELEALYDASPAQTVALVTARAKGSVVPVDLIGHVDDSELSALDDDYKALFGAEKVS